MSEKSYRDAIREAMMEEMDRDEKVLIMGEDIGVYEGTFRITAGMLKKYGPKRVIDTPIAEAGMAGTAVGMAMLGLRPIVEMMTMNFAFVAADQILNHAARSEEHTSELQSRRDLVCRLLLEKKKNQLFLNYYLQKKTITTKQN